MCMHSYIETGYRYHSKTEHQMENETEAGCMRCLYMDDVMDGPK